MGGFQLCAIVTFRLMHDIMQLFSFKDRKANKFLLAPTHEEEITSLVANAVHSYKDLPLRLYQISKCLNSFHAHCHHLKY